MTTPVALRDRRLLGIEVLVVLGISLGQSAVYSLLSIWDKLTRPETLAQQVTTMNASRTPDRPWLDLAYQVAGTLFPLMPAVLALYLLWAVRPPEGDPLRGIGFDLRRPWRDLGLGVAVFAVIGVAGLAFYLAAVRVGINTQVSPANLTAQWWTVPVLVGRACMNGVLEEVVMVGYLFTRWAQRGGSMATILWLSALVRGGYHLYQGFGGFVGNLVMGLVFGWLFLRTRRVMPLVVVHVLLDLVAFLGAGLLQYLPFAPR
ncbi:CPBP family intramembrane glutamic endopeptidase [uncultured Tessaracoccus sp.]|uniref:CPBP family intramembrane glutamic endopeptidase n=1 Tax=uncultured Tessaracoccus sp. TaxID=905023 RepID=UPI0025F8A30F|nr:CPBP family intramembrane glutamic endopeptidase [uncultured Tessaracoccus sp.]